MPIYLPPLSRRRFLGRAAVLGAGLALAPKITAAQAKPVAANTWALLSDIHIDADRKAVERGVTMANHLEAVVHDVLALENRPEGVIITGDCAHGSGKNGDYAVMAELLKPLREAGIQIHLLVGNHDHRERFWLAFREQSELPRPVADKHVAVLKTAFANWFMLDSLEHTASTPGWLGRAQLDWLGKALDENADKPALVLLHHNAGLDGNMGIKDTVAFFETIRPRKQVKAYIYGHTHVWRTERDNTGIHLVNLPATAYVFKEGTPSGWVLARVKQTGVELELRCIDATHQAHRQTVSLDWLRRS
jgi:3',5'-cyclic AMP phosphodiesterase CpdA